MLLLSLWSQSQPLSGEVNGLIHITALVLFLPQKERKKTLIVTNTFQFIHFLTCL